MNPTSPQLDVTGSFVSVIQWQADQQNAADYAIYQRAFANWIQQSETAPPGNAPAEPNPPMLRRVNAAIVATLFDAWATTMSLATVNHQTTPPLDLSSAITFEQAARLTVPAPPAPTGPKVGPLIAPGQWAKVMGDDSQPGTKTNNGPGGATYVLVGVQTPFGYFGSHWTLASNPS